MQCRGSRIFRIADVAVCLETEQSIEVTEEFQPFCSTGKADYQICFQEVPKLPGFPENILYQNECFAVAFDRLYYRKFTATDTVCGDSYAVGVYDWDERRIFISYLPGRQKYFTGTRNCFFHIAWETLLLRENRLILHSCCVDTEYGGILFSGPSGIGKSTQGKLWRIHRNTREINGDRGILCRADTGWKAYGSPYAGSSKCYVNASVPVRGIVMLRQAEDNGIRRLGAAEAFRRIFTQLTVPVWDDACTRRACELAEQLAAEVPVYELSCTPDIRAVELLEEALQKEEKL